MDITVIDYLDSCISRWVNSMYDEKTILEELLKDIQETIKLHTSSDDLNFYIYEILTYMAYALKPKNPKRPAVDSTNTKVVYETTNFLCSKLIMVPDADSDKYLSALYYIVKFLLEGNLYSEAKTITAYLLPESNIMPNPKEISSWYVDFANLWGKNTVNVLKSLSQFSDSFYGTYQSMVRTELDLIRATDVEYYTEEVLGRFYSHLSRFKEFCESKKVDNMFLDFFETTLDYLTKYDFDSGIEEYSTFYEIVLSLITILFYENISVKSLGQVTKIYHDICNIFESCLIFHREYYEKFKSVRSMIQVLLQDISKEPILDTTDLAVCFMDFRTIGSVNQFQYCHVYVKFLLSVFKYWEECVGGQSVPKFLDENFMDLLMNFIDLIGSILAERNLGDCKFCDSEECDIQLDLHNAIIVKLRFLDVFTRFQGLYALENFEDKCQRFMWNLIGATDNLNEHRCQSWPRFWSTLRIVTYIFENRGRSGGCGIPSAVFPMPALKLQDIRIHFDHRALEDRPKAVKVVIEKSVDLEGLMDSDVSDEEDLIPETAAVTEQIHKPSLADIFKW